MAHALSSLIDDDSILDILQSYESILIDNYAARMRKKLGLKTILPDDHLLYSRILGLMASDKIDYSILFSLLCIFQENQENKSLVELFTQKEKCIDWCQHYTLRLQQEDRNKNKRQQSMK